MVKIFFLLLSLLNIAVAAEGMVVVLEAPMFRRPDVSSDVIQHVRKGKRVYIHPVVVSDRSRFTDVPVPREAIEKNLATDGDPMPISKELFEYDDAAAFVLTKDNQGRDAWMLREHVHVFYNDKREYAQRDPSPDPTDYRLLEPLPDTYPLVRSEQLRGLIGVSFGSPYTRTYPYNEKIKAESYGYQMEFNGAMTRRLEMDKKGRWYGGGVLTLRTTNSKYTLESRRAEEQWVRFGVGPLISFDAWRSDAYRMTLTGAAIAYPYAQVNVSQGDTSGDEESRNYRGYSMSARLGAQWTVVKLVGELDMVIGVWGEAESPMKMQANSSTNRRQWWGGGKNDNFNPNTTFTMAGIVGLQSTY